MCSWTGGSRLLDRLNKSCEPYKPTNTGSVSTKTALAQVGRMGNSFSTVEPDTRKESLSTSDRTPCYGRPAHRENRFYEAWRINAGDVTPFFGAGQTDLSEWGGMPNSSGNVRFTGTIKFFCESVTGNLNSLWSKGGNPSSISLPSTNTKPSWWDQAPVDSGFRQASSDWVCCCPLRMVNNVKTDPQ